MRILFVDDNQTYCEITTTILRAKGFDVDCAVTPEQLHSLFPRIPYDCIILDYNFESSCLGVVAFLKDKLSSPRIIVISGSPLDSLKDVKELVDSGAVCGFLHKPFLVGDLIDMIVER